MKRAFLWQIGNVDEADVLVMALAGLISSLGPTRQYEREIARGLLRMLTEAIQRGDLKD